MSQLPVLIYDQKLPMSSEEFKALALSVLDENDSFFLNLISLDPDPEKTEPAYKEVTPATGCEFIDNWREWERTFRLNLAKQRAHHLKREISSIEPPVMPADAALAASKAVSGDYSPLEAEFLIDKARWNAIVEIAGFEYFSLSHVLAYYLKLLLMERRASFNNEKGISEYKSLYASILGKAQQSPGELK
jgi:hypothetical protein